MESELDTKYLRNTVIKATKDNLKHKWKLKNDKQDKFQ